MTKDHPPVIRHRQEGFALILAILALMLLTSLGLSLSTTTSIEMQIAVNHRWSEQARYNAEAGVEFAKEFLSTVPDWSTILPPARVSTWVPTATPGAIPTDAARSRSDAWGNPTRNFESYSCDQRGFGRGYGVVLDDGTAEGPYQFKQGAGGLILNGAFTLWIRRPVQWGNSAATALTSTTLQDYVGNDAMIVVSEGIAPFSPNSRSTNRSTQIIEILLSQGAQGMNIVVPGESQCSSRQGQSGGSAQGTNSAGCTVLAGPSSLTAALAGATNLGTGVLK